MPFDGDSGSSSEGESANQQPADQREFDEQNQLANHIVDIQELQEVLLQYAGTRLPNGQWKFCDFTFVDWRREQPMDQQHTNVQIPEIPGWPYNTTPLDQSESMDVRHLATKKKWSTEPRQKLYRKPMPKSLSVARQRQRPKWKTLRILTQFYTDVDEVVTRYRCPVVAINVPISSLESFRSYMPRESLTSYNRSMILQPPAPSPREIQRRRRRLVSQLEQASMDGNNPVQQPPSPSMPPERNLLLFAASLANGPREEPSVNGPREQPSVNGSREQPSANGPREEPSVNGPREQPSANGPREESSANGPREQPLAVSRISRMQRPITQCIRFAFYRNGVFTDLLAETYKIKPGFANAEELYRMIRKW